MKKKTEDIYLFSCCAMLENSYCYHSTDQEMVMEYKKFKGLEFYFEQGRIGMWKEVGEN